MAHVLGNWFLQYQSPILPKTAWPASSTHDRPPDPLYTFINTSCLLEVEADTAAALAPAQSLTVSKLWPCNFDGPAAVLQSAGGAGQLGKEMLDGHVDGSTALLVFTHLVYTAEKQRSTAGHLHVLHTLTPPVLHVCVGEWVDTTVAAQRWQIRQLLFTYTYIHLQVRQRYTREGYTRRWVGVHVCRLYTIAQLFTGGMAMSLLFSMLLCMIYKVSGGLWRKAMHWWAKQRVAPLCRSPGHTTDNTYLYEMWGLLVITAGNLPQPLTIFLTQNTGWALSRLVLYRSTFVAGKKDNSL